MLRIIEVTKTLPPGFDRLRVLAKQEGFNHIDRLAQDWATGVTRFDRSGESLLAAFIENDLVGIGGLTIDPDSSAQLRMRRFYVSPTFRGQSIGRALADKLLNQTQVTITVNAPEDAHCFWQAIGFRPDHREGHTHILVR